MRWEDMKGDNKQRFCQSCNLHVHNFAALSQSEAERLVRTSTGRLCGILYRRADGTVLTKDCPVGLRAARERALKVAARTAALVAFLLTGAALWASGRKEPWETARIRALEPFAAIARRISPQPVPMPGLMILGDVCIQPPAQPPTAPSN